jgi:hypothetical protein
MEITRRYLIAYPTGFAAYLALQRALIARYQARGGTAEEFCLRLAPVFRKRYAELLADAPSEPAGVPEATPRLRQESLRDAA